MVLATDGEMSFSQFRYGRIHEDIEYVIVFDVGDGLRGAELGRIMGGGIPDELLSTLTATYRIDGKKIKKYYFRYF